MSSEYTTESENAELRKRAAWVLGLLVLVAALFIVIMVTFFNGSSGGSTNDAGPTIVTTPSSAHRSTPSTRTSTSASPSSPSGRATSSGPASCPGSAPCVLDGDPGSAIAAINAYRTAHNLPAATGTVSKAAQACAVSNGDNCSGSWAESQVGTATGQAALNQILSRGHVLSDYSSFEIGWAWDPSGKQYFFAMIRTG